MFCFASRASIWCCTVGNTVGYCALTALGFLENFISSYLWVKMSGCCRKKVATSIVEALGVPENLTYSTKAKKWRTKRIYRCHLKMITCASALCKTMSDLQKKKSCFMVSFSILTIENTPLRVFEMLILLLSPFFNSLSFSHACVWCSAVCCFAA